MLLQPEALNAKPDVAPKKIYVFIIGTRAQLIKVAPILVACEKASLQCLMLMTGQHKETMQDLIDEFQIQSRQTPAIPAAEHATVGSLIRWLPAAYSGVKAKLKEIVHSGFDVDVLVHGDTLSTLIGAYAGYRCGARIVHLESGLTSGNWLDPFPEEICRRLVFRMTDLAMCPTEVAAKHMAQYQHALVVNTEGNSIFDAVILTGASEVVADEQDPYLIASLHRFQNIYNSKRLRYLVHLIQSISAHHRIYFILHPATRKRLQKEGLIAELEANPNINLSARMGYRAFIRLAAGSACVLTDGGSNQEELAFLGVPTIVMRAHTERPDGLQTNAIMEAQVKGSVEQFIYEKHYAGMRTPARVILGDTPSTLMVKALTQA